MPCIFLPRVRTRTETPSDSTGPASASAHETPTSACEDVADSLSDVEMKDRGIFTVLESMIRKGGSEKTVAFRWFKRGIDIIFD